MLFTELKIILFMKKNRVFCLLLFKPFKTSLLLLLICSFLQLFGLFGFFCEECLINNIHYANSYLMTDSIYLKEHSSTSAVLDDPFFEELNVDHSLKYFQGRSYLFDAVGTSGYHNFSIIESNDYELANAIGDKKLIYGDFSSAAISKKAAVLLFSKDKANYSELIGQTVQIYKNNVLLSSIIVSGVFEEKQTPGLVSPVYSGSSLDYCIFLHNPGEMMFNEFESVGLYTRILLNNNKSLKQSIISLCVKHNTDFIDYDYVCDSLIGKYNSLFVALRSFSLVAIPFSLSVQIAIMVAFFEGKQRFYYIFKVFSLDKWLYYKYKFGGILLLITIPILICILLTELIKLSLYSFLGINFVSLWIVLLSLISVVAFPICSLMLRHYKTPDIL